MVSSGGACEIVEAKEELNLVHNSNGSSPLNFKLRANQRDGKTHVYPVADELDQLIKAIDLRISSRMGHSHQMGVVPSWRSTLKKPVGLSQASGTEISESVTLKQALRRLCISQASEMAAIKRLSKPIGISGVSETGTIQRLYSSVVVQASNSDPSLNGEKGNLVEISLVPEKSVDSSSDKATKIHQSSGMDSSNQTAVCSSQSAMPVTVDLKKTRAQDATTSSVKAGDSSPVVVGIGVKGNVNAKTSMSASLAGVQTRKPNIHPHLTKPGFRKKACLRKKGKQVAALSSNACRDGDRVGALSRNTNLPDQKESTPPTSCNMNPNGILRMKHKDNGVNKPDHSPNSSKGVKSAGVKMSENIRSRRKGECSQSSKSSLGDYSSSTSISEESNLSGSSGNVSRPHMSKDVRWVAIRHVMMRSGSLGLKHFKLLKRLGCGDIGTVYLAKLIGSECLFALKVMDSEFLLSRNKMPRAQTEKEILQMLDHPFLPTLYAEFTTDNLSYLVMDYCPGGDLHVLRQKQPGRSFAEAAARFYVAEVLLALEYLHMLGVVYRDLKPENILVREDGHIMLSDFDLSLMCTVNPTLLRSSSVGTQEPVKKPSGPCVESNCMEPLCLQPSWAQVSCFTPRIGSRKLKPDLSIQVSPLPQLVVEPTDARSNSFVGTHEYLAPEIIRGDGHGSAVDWWTFGIFLYELLYGKTPFKGPGHEETLANVVSQSLGFPESPVVSCHARDLIRGLLIKEPEHRLGSIRGAAEIKQHAFFDGLNWALIRCAAPPKTPRKQDSGTPIGVYNKREARCLDFGANGEDVKFELF